MMYKVISYFEDLQDHSRPYNVGDTFPVDGVSVTPERLAELSSNRNRRGIPLIEAVAEAPKPKRRRAAEQAESPLAEN